MDAVVQNGIALNPKSILQKVDTEPTVDSQNPVSSGGVKTYVDQKDAATNERINTVNTQLASSFFFKGTSTYSSLPGSGNTVNDTYYVTDVDKQCWYSWNGTAWSQSSMSQADYAGLIAQLQSDISNNFSDQNTYSIGDYCLHGDGVLYVCKVAITTAGAWTGNTNWQAISFGDAMSNIITASDTQPTSAANKIWLNTDPAVETVDVVTVDDLSNIVVAEFDSTSAYSVGDYVMHDAKMYVAKTNSAANDGWVANRWTQVTIMNTLNDQVGDLKTQLNNVDGYFVPGINMFNPNDPDIVDNVWLLNSGDLEQNHAGFFASGFYPVIPGATVCLNYSTATFGTSSIIVWYDENKLRIGYTSSVERLTDSRGYTYIRYAIPQNGTAVYFRVTGYMANKPYIMYVYAAEMPETYEAYTTDVELSEAVKVPFANIEDVTIDKDDTDFVLKNPKNLVDLEEVETGVIGNGSSSATVDSSATNWRTTDFVPVKPNTVYSMFVAPGVYYGSGFNGIPFFGANKNYLGRIIPEGGISTSSVQTTITTPNRADIAYIRTSYPASYVNTPKSRYNTMIIEGSTWPGNMYIHYDNEYRLEGAGLSEEFSEPLNCLFGKTALWNGDSICAADGDPIGGWPERIAKSNGMRCKNYAISGGTIAENTGDNRHSVSATLNGMLTDFPNADYIIIEGGTNDADILRGSGIGAFDENDFSAEYITALDKNTFSGALESIFYRLVTVMKGKSIGYLIPQKMGHTEEFVEWRCTYFNRAKQIAQKWGIPVLNLWDDLYFNWRLSAHWDQTMTSAENNAANNLYRDGQHLTDFGYQIQSPIIAEWMKGI